MIRASLAPSPQGELQAMHAAGEAAGRRSAECQDMLAELQEFAAHQQTEIQDLHGSLLVRRD